MFIVSVLSALSLLTMAANSAINEEISKTEEKIRQLAASSAGLTPRESYGLFDLVDRDVG